MPAILTLFAQHDIGGWARTVDRLAKTPISQILVFSLVLTVIRLAVVVAGRGSILRGGARFVSESTDALVYAGIVVFMLVRPFVLQTFVIPSGSMIDTLRIGDYIAANKWAYRLGPPRDGDIVVFKPPKEAPREDGDDTNYIKRLIGAPGDLIEVKNRVLWRNGKAVDEPYVDFTDGSSVLPQADWPRARYPDFKLVKHGGKMWPVQLEGGEVRVDAYNTPPAYMPPDAQTEEALKNGKPEPVPQGYYLFLGDNRNGSLDGRFWGLVPRKDIIGKAWFVWFPLSRARGL